MDKEITAPNAFIIGTQRSGTTLLTRLLSSHSTYYAQNELPVENIFKNANSRKEIVENMDKEFSRAHQGLSIKQFVTQEKKSQWCLKDPQLTEYLTSLEYFTSTAKFILITRDARGVVSSYIDQKWGLGTNAFTGALRWKNEIELQFRFMNKYKKQFIHIRFEDLIGNMEESTRKICRHLDIEFEPSMLDYYKTEGFIEKRHVNEQNINTSKKPDAKVSSKWKNKLTLRQIGIIETVVNDELVSMGYELETGPVQLTRLEKNYYLLHQKIFGWIQLQYQWRKARWLSSH